MMQLLNVQIISIIKYYYMLKVIYSLIRVLMTMRLLVNIGEINMKVQKVNLNIRISPIRRKKFKEVAESNNRKCSEVLRELIKEYIMEKDISK